jgi:RNA polymerase sigma factor (sigma-70 family)
MSGDRSGSASPDERIELLFRQHGHRALGYLARRVQPVEDAADLLSETMMITWRRRADLPAAPDDVPWLFGVARNVLANHRRASQRRDVATAQLAQVLTGIACPSSSDHVDAGLDVRRALRELSDLDREIVTLSAWDGLTSTEISAVLTLPSATVRTRLARARRRLRQLIAADVAEEEDRAGAVQVTTAM